MSPTFPRKKTATPASAKPKRTPKIQQQDDQALETIEVKAVEVTEVDVISNVTSEELNQDEQRDRLNLERKVEHAFYEAGKALKELRDRRLYRSTHKTFEEYCRDRFGFTRMSAALKIASVKVMDNLSTNGLQNAETSKGGLQERKMSTNGLQILPTNERQLRPLTNLEPEQQREVWKQAVQEAGGKIPSGRIVQSIVDKIRERTKIPNPYREGEICILVPRDNPDLRGKGGCWGAITHAGDFSCTVQTWDGEYTVKIEHLKSLELLDDDCKSMQQLCMRLRRLHQVADHDPSVDWLLQGLGKQAKPYLSALQARILGAMEREYGLDGKK
ncbi:hypothetical protein NIES21_59390 (plasmid) [Anabaenopsis circularis NIES-21]|uniref:Uncharacterized protein n=1 Tax=Anabaenopsis circularis NIES-21 TaxID=1085406 RepID=A0A1Z4GRE6_9CYAN|nr:hypothetical protein NIES21_59390 [Anabaenopsis circularis NIES-21]